MPVYYIIAILLIFAGLFSLRYEIAFLKSTKIGVFGWVITILNFLTVFSLVAVLLAHRLLNQVYALFIILTLLIILLIVSAIQLVSRRMVFTRLKRELIEQKRDLILETRDLIDEKKREKIREKYKENNSQQSSNGKSS